MTIRDVGEYKKLLCDGSFVGSLPDAAVDTLLIQGRISHAERGDTVFSKGDEGDSLLLVLRGRLKVSNLAADGGEVVLGFLVEGDVIGEIAALDGRGRTATVTALEKSSFLGIYRSQLLPLLLSHPTALLEVVEVLCDRLRGANAIAEDGLYDMRQRAARGLLRLAEKHGRRINGKVVIDLNLNQRDLGNFLRLSRENTNRQLSSLRAKHVVDVENAIITILDEPALRQMAGDD
ncbi:MAG: Crp/Fnr family transcriptional regulator [Hyphomicrobiaceae bacterium]